MIDYCYDLCVLTSSSPSARLRHVQPTDHRTRPAHLPSFHAVPLRSPCGRLAVRVRFRCGSGAHWNASSAVFRLNGVNFRGWCRSKPRKASSFAVPLNGSLPPHIVSLGITLIYIFFCFFPLFFFIVLSDNKHAK